jgi:hypothetical protein
MLTVCVVCLADSVDASAAVPITDVHVVFSNHLDVGFDGIAPTPGFSANVVDRYFTEYFPRAIETAANISQASGGKSTYTWMTQCWLVSLYFDCPPNMNFTCPTDDEKAAVAQAITDGVITWHAFPFNSELETMEPSLAAAGVDLCHKLSDQLGNPRATTFSQRDVPGTTRGMIPILTSMGVTGMSFGVNGFTSPPAYPRISVWRDEASQTDLLMAYHPFGYGACDPNISLSDAATLPNLGHAMIPCWNGDNKGPQTSSQVLSIFSTVQSMFPGANVYASTFDAFFDQVETVKESLPMFTGETGDTWIFGIASDPKKLAQFRALQRIRAECLESGACDIKSQDFLNFTRLLLKASEHTWGMDVKEMLDADDLQGVYYAWNNTAFARSLSSPLVQALSQSWVEQRNWAIDYALQALPANHTIVTAAQAAFVELVVDGPPDTTGYTNHSLDNGPISLSTTQVSFALCPMFGFMINLTDTITGVQWSTSSRPLASILYQTFTESNYTSFREYYGTCDSRPGEPCWWAGEDFGKPGLDASAQPEYQTVAPNVQAIWSKSSGANEVDALVQLAFDPQLPKLYGAPSELWVHINVVDTTVSVDVIILNKPATRIPESLWISFDAQRDPTLSPAWTLDKLGSSIQSNNIILNGSQTLHGVWNGASILHSSPNGGIASFQVESPDAALVYVGPAEDLSPFPQLNPDIHTNQDALVYNLVNNIWATNYISQSSEGA